MANFPTRPPDPPPGHLRTSDLLGALSLAADMAVGLSVEHALRSCYIGMHIADALGMPPDQQADLYYAELLMDAGCTAWTSQLAAFIASDEIVARREFVFFSNPRNPFDALGWLWEHVAAGAPARERVRRSLDFALHGRAFVREAFRNTCEVAQGFARRLGMSDAVQAALLSVFEQWDGSGPNGARAAEIPIISRIVYATSFLEVTHRIGGSAAASRLARRMNGTAFDPAVIAAFLTKAEKPSFWAGLEQESVWETVLAMEPDSPSRYLGAERLEDVALSFADFADLKSPHLIGHSRRVAALAERCARQMGLPAEEVKTVRLAALTHDVGQVAVSSFVLGKPREALTPAEWERLRLHPYYAERILGRLSIFAPILSLVAAHHERPDGQGYPHGLSGAQIPRGARIIAVADGFDELTHDMPGHSALDPIAALARMREQSGRAFCRDALAALMAERGMPALAVSVPAERSRQRWPAGLTDREIEILRLLAKGLSRRETAEALFLSEHTVRHHLEHIYNKLGVTTRVSATLYAVEHGLLP
jgi:HD-GYP domain-containing protein (c-di-GMP phosphodiesterase class II)/DNA-binding CsgD family transcriptional regulator